MKTNERERLHAPGKGGIRSTSFPDGSMKPLTREEIKARITNWEGMKHLNADDPKTVSLCDRMISQYTDRLKLLGAS